MNLFYGYKKDKGRFVVFCRVNDFELPILNFNHENSARVVSTVLLYDQWKSFSRSDLLSVLGFLQ